MERRRLARIGLRGFYELGGDRRFGTAKDDARFLLALGLCLAPSRPAKRPGSPRP